MCADTVVIVCDDSVHGLQIMFYGNTQRHTHSTGLSQASEEK